MSTDSYPDLDAPSVTADPLRLAVERVAVVRGAVSRAYRLRHDPPSAAAAIAAARDAIAALGAALDDAEGELS